MVKDTFRRLSAVVALVAWFGGGVAPALDIHAEGAAVCVETVGPRSSDHHRSARFTGLSSQVDDTHCVLCHLQRTVRGSSHGVGGFSHLLAPIGTAADATLQVARVDSRRGVPSRAPPVTP